VKIEPHLGDLKDVNGKMPHPAGSIFTEYKLENGKWKIKIELPEKISGQLVWKGKSYPLKEGLNIFNL
jgi:alpha-L-rhamnosidase